MTSLISVETSSTSRNSLPLDKAVTAAVEKFAADNEGEIESFDLSGTVLEASGFGRSLVKIVWKEKEKKSKK